MSRDEPRGLFGVPGGIPLGIGAVVTEISWAWGYEWLRYCGVSDDWGRPGLPSVGVVGVEGVAPMVVVSPTSPNGCHGASAEKGRFTARSV